MVFRKTFRVFLRCTIYKKYIDKEIMKMEVGREEIVRLVKMSPGNSAVYLMKGGRFETVYSSSGIPRILGLEPGEYDSSTSFDAMNILLPADRPYVTDAIMKMLADKTPMDIYYRVFHSVRGFDWVHAKACICGELDGAPMLFFEFSNASVESDIYQDILDHTERMIYVVDCETYEILYANRSGRAYNPLSSNLTPAGALCHQYIRGNNSPCDDCFMRRSRETSDLDLIRYNAENDHWERLTGQFINWCGHNAFVQYIDDVTDGENMRRELKKANDKFEIAAAAAEIGVWEYSIKDHTITSPSHTFRKFGIDDKIENVPASILHLFPADEQEKLIDTFRRLDAGEERIENDFRMIWKPGTHERYEHVVYSLMRDKNGDPDIAYGIGMDITDRKNEQKKYRQSIQALLSANPEALCTFQLNLTKNLCSEGHSASHFIMDSLSAETADGLIERLETLVPDQNERKMIAEKFDRKQLIASFEAGISNVHVDYRRIGENGKPFWVRTSAAMLKNPESNDIEGVIYSLNITDEMQQKRIFDLMMSREYDLFALLHLDSGIFEAINMSENLPRAYNELLPSVGSSASFSDFCDNALRTWIDENDRESYRKNENIENIRRELGKNDAFEISVTAHFPDRPYEAVRRRIQHYYSGDDPDTVLIMESDVTEAYRHEINAREQLEIALTAAKQASSAKSNFLSRMSHEIRTPMNAIIGMDAIAAQSIGNDERLSDCIAKIGLSARYLLSLINDILDMSRIESGKMLIKNDSFLFRDFITGINTMIYNQTKSKGLDYECTVSNRISDGYIGDSMKLQQILINVLGNAVKFTNTGKISMDVSVLSQTKSVEKLRFTISDTGCGIKESAITKIFEPFEQVDTSTTSVFGGTGLGLAITKNLTELMSGTINVRSIEGVGSEFTIDIPLTVDASSVKRQPFDAANLVDLHTLIVDDDITICEQTHEILKEAGMIGEWVTSGREAVEKVREHFDKNFFYDFILIDWKMPDMDGIETTRKIRSIVGPDVTIIIISAYDWEAIETEAKAAGANMLISKPLFRSTLISAFEKAKGEVEMETEKKTEYDFTGKRVLLTEDNQINSEIAKILLESKHFSVEIASTGLQAMQLFTQNPVGYYDAILMDIRMPVMDGLHAAKNIRMWDREDAKCIPIIAMTANAFDEDINKSKAAGMNAHLSKPIDPDLLYETLNRILNDKT